MENYINSQSNGSNIGSPIKKPFVPGGGGSSQTVLPQKSNVETNFERLRMGVEYLFSNVDILSKKLEPLLLDGCSEKECAAAPAQVEEPIPTCKVSREIREIENKINTISDIVTSLNQKLQL
jgi:hypothetical protein